MKLFNIAHNRMTGYGRYAVSISSLANGALGERVISVSSWDYQR
jgi:hypothetical protein